MIEEFCGTSIYIETTIWDRGRDEQHKDKYTKIEFVLRQ